MRHHRFKPSWPRQEGKEKGQQAICAAILNFQRKIWSKIQAVASERQGATRIPCSANIGCTQTRKLRRLALVFVVVHEGCAVRRAASRHPSILWVILAGPELALSSGYRCGSAGNRFFACPIADIPMVYIQSHELTLENWWAPVPPF